MIYNKKFLIFFFNKLYFIYKYSHSWKEETQNFCSLKNNSFAFVRITARRINYYLTNNPLSMLRTIIITIKIMIPSPDSFSSVPGEEKKLSRERNVE